jgi:hypothetical protein
MKKLLNEDVIKMQKLAGLKKEETLETVKEDFIVWLNESYPLLKEGTLNESLWEKAKYYLSKLGRYKANGKIFGKDKVDQEAIKKIDDILAKEGNDIIRKIDAGIKQYNSEFPNNESARDFLKTCLEIAKIYDSIVDATEKDPEDKEYMPVDAANVVIADLREYVKDILDRQVKAAYSVTNEAEREKIGDTDNYSKGDAKKLLQRRKGEEKFDSYRMKTLRSWNLPLALFGVGGALGGVSWLLDLLKDKADLISVLKGEGLTQTLNRINAAKNWGLPQLGPNATLDDVKEHFTKIGEGNYKEGLDRLTADNGMFKDPDQGRQALAALTKADGSKTLGDFFKGKFAGTGASPGDMLVTRSLGKILLKKGATAAGSWLGTVASGLGVALVAGSAVTALARLKGRKSSRAATLNDLYQSLKDVESTKENPAIIDEPINTTEPTADKDKKPEVPTGVDGKPLPSDVKTVKNDIEQSTSVKTALGKIDTADDFRDLILQMSQFVSANLRKDKASLKSALFAIANMLKGKQKQAAKAAQTTVQEDYSTFTPDTNFSANAIEATKSLAQHLQNINDRREFADLIFSILPFIDPNGKITQDRNKLANIIFAAASKIDKFVADRDKDPAKRPGGLS